MTSLKLSRRGAFDILRWARGVDSELLELESLAELINLELLEDLGRDWRGTSGSESESGREKAS